jgi:hypothetical protein
MLSGAKLRERVERSNEKCLGTSTRWIESAWEIDSNGGGIRERAIQGDEWEEVMVSPRRALIKHHNRVPEKFDPAKYKLTDAVLDFGIKEARRLKDWPTLEEAVDTKIAEQFKFISWRKVSMQPRGQPKKSNGGVRLLSSSEITKISGITEMQVVRIGKRLAKPAKYRADLLGVSYLAAQLAEPDHFRTNFSGNNEWHTPARYIELARKVLGEIDLDPASSKLAQKTVRAANFFALKDDGLTKPWHGRVWLNPPYSPKEIAAFVDKLCDELKAGRVSAAIMLTHNYTDSGWFQQAARLVAAICFPDTRVRFEDADGVPCSPTQGQAFFYFGADRAKFIEVFNLGFVVVRP